MKLIDFYKFDPFLKLKKNMGIKKEEETSIDFTTVQIRSDWEIIKSEGLDIALDQLHVAKDGTLEYDKLPGQKMIVYIRDQQAAIDGGVGTYRYHISWCRTLEEMKNKNRYDRYVVSQRTDGKFFVNLMKYGEIISKGLEVEMQVCKNCLSKLRYQGYESKMPKNDKNQIHNNFSIDEFLKKYNTSIPIEPTYTEDTAPLNTYTDDWRKVSQEYKRSKGWNCEGCGRNFSKNRRYLDVHHRDGNKSNNQIWNLEALCKDCHSKEPYHKHMKPSAK